VVGSRKGVLVQRRAARGGERKAPLMTRIPSKTFFGEKQNKSFSFAHPALFFITQNAK
jgi:hypothetical protein